MKHRRPSIDRIIGMRGPRLTGFLTSRLQCEAEAARIFTSASELVLSRGRARPCLFRVLPTPGLCSQGLSQNVLPVLTSAELPKT